MLALKQRLKSLKTVTMMGTFNSMVLVSESCGFLQSSLAAFISHWTPAGPGQSHVAYKKLTPYRALESLLALPSTCSISLPALESSLYVNIRVSPSVPAVLMVLSIF